MTDSPDLVALSKARRLARSGTARMIRSNAGISLAELAAGVGVSPSTVFRWETGLRSPHGAAALRYVALLDRIASES